MHQHPWLHNLHLTVQLYSDHSVKLRRWYARPQSCYHIHICAFNVLAWLQRAGLLLQVSSEWAQAKTEASQAKAVGDKNKQKSIGLVIRSLKQEMKELGAPALLSLRS